MKRSAISGENITMITQSQGGSNYFYSKIRQQQKEIYQLGRIVELKDSTLEEINRIFQQQVKHSQINVEQLRSVSLLLDRHNVQQKEIGKVEEMIDRLREVISQMDFQHLEFYEAKMLDITARHNEQMKELIQLQNQGKINFSQPSSSRGRIDGKQESIIYEIPIEVIPQLQTQSTFVQVDMFDTPLNQRSTQRTMSQKDFRIQEIIQEKIDQIVEIPVSMIEIHEIPYDCVQLHEVPIVLNQTYDIPIQMEITDHLEETEEDKTILRYSSFPSEQLSSLKKENEDLYGQLEQMREQIDQMRERNLELDRELDKLKNRSLFLEIGDKRIPIDNADYDIPLEIQFETDPDKNICVYYDDGLIQIQNDLENAQEPDHQTNNQITCEVEQQAMEIPNNYDASRFASVEVQTEYWDNVRQVIVERPVIHQLPVQLLLQSETLQNVLNENRIIQEVPVEVYITVPVIHQIPVVVEVEKIVEKIIEKQVIKEIDYSQGCTPFPAERPSTFDWFGPPPEKKGSSIEKIKQAEVIKEIEVVKQVPVIKTVIKEVPVEVIIYEQIEKIVVHEVPVEVFVRSEQNVIDVSAEYGSGAPLVYASGRITGTDLQQPQQLKAQPNQYQSSLHPQLQIVEIPTELVIDRFIEVEKTIQIQKTQEVKITETIEYQVQKIVPYFVEIPVELSHLSSESDKLGQKKVDIFEVPVECVVEKRVQIDRPIDHFISVPKYVQIYLEKPVEVFVDRITEVPVQLLLTNELEFIPQVDKIFEVPVEVLIPQEFQTIIEVPVQLHITKQVEKIVEKIREVPVEVLITEEKQKIVYVDRIVEVPVQVIIKEEIQKLIYVEKPVYIDRIKQIPVEVVIIEEKIVQVAAQHQHLQYLGELQADTLEGSPSGKGITEKKIVEVPVEVFIEIEKVVEKIVEVPKIVQIPVTVIVEVEKEVDRIINIYRTVEVQKLVEVQTVYEVPVDVIIQSQNQVEKLVEVNHIVEVPVELHMSDLEPKIVEIPVELIVEVEKQVQKMVYIDRVVEKEVEKIVYVDKIIEVEREVYVPYVVEVPVELSFEPEIYQIPVEIKQFQTVQIPKAIEQSAIQDPEVQDVMHSPAGSTFKSGELLPHPKNIQNQPLKLDSREMFNYQLSSKQTPTKRASSLRERSVQKDKSVEGNKIASKEQQIVEPPFMNTNNRQPLDLDQFRGLSRIKASEQHKLESNSEKEFKGKMESMLKVWEIPVELELDYNIEEMQRQLQDKYKDKYAALNSKYQTEIQELHNTIQDIQKIVLQLNFQKIQLKEEVEKKALKEQSLQRQIQDLEEKESKFESEKARIKEKANQRSDLIQRMHEQNQRLQNKIKQIIGNPVLRELPVQLNVFVDTEDQQIQTEALDLYSHLEVLEVPINLNIKEHSDIRKVQSLPQEPLRRSLVKDNRSSLNQKGDVTPVNLSYESEASYGGLVGLSKRDNIGSENKKISTEEANEAHEKTYTDMGPVPSNFQELSRMYSPEQIMKMVEQLKLYESGSHQNNKTIINQNNTVDYGNRTVESILPNTIDEVINRSDYQEIIDHAQVFELPVEMIMEPIIYEVPINIKETVDTVEQQVQTDEIRIQTEIPSLPNIIELPVQLVINPNNHTSYPSIRIEEPEQVQLPDFPTRQSQKIDAHYPHNESNLVEEQLEHYNRLKEKIQKEKPMAQFFRDRIIQIPIEVETIKDQVNIEIQTILHNYDPDQQDKEEGKKEQKFTLDVFTRIDKQVHAQRFKILPAYEPMAICVERQVVGIKEEGGHLIKVQSKCSLPSSNNILYQNELNGQAYIPNLLDFSEQLLQRKKDLPKSLESDIADHPINPQQSDSPKILPSELRRPARPSDNISVGYEYTSAQPSELNPKKAYQYPESSIQNMTHYREMVIEDSLDTINQATPYEADTLQSPGLEPHNLSFNDIAYFRDKMVELEEQKNRYQQLYQKAIGDESQFRQIVAEKDEQIFKLKVFIDEESAKQEEELRRIGLQFQNAEKEYNEQEKILMEQKITIMELQESKEKLEEKIEKLIEGYEKLKEDSEKIQMRLGQQIQKLKVILSEKREEIKEMREEVRHKGQEYQHQLNQMTEIINSKEEAIKNHQEQFSKKQEEYEMLYQDHEQMRKNIGEMRRNAEINPAEIYEQQFLRVKEILEEEKHNLNMEITALQHQLQAQKLQTEEQAEQVAALRQQIEELQRQIQETRHENSQLHHVKSQIESNYISGVKELEQMREKVKEKIQIINKYEQSHQIQHVANEIRLSGDEHVEDIKIEYISKGNSTIQDRDQRQRYIHELQEVILKYEQMLLNNQKTIQDYQSKVCEYLKDALQKEQQAEILFARVVDYEQKINSILVDKVTLEIENKQLLKSIEMSERKIEVLGSRLIEAARRKAEQQRWEVRSDRYY